MKLKLWQKIGLIILCIPLLMLFVATVSPKPSVDNKPSTSTLNLVPKTIVAEPTSLPVPKAAATVTITLTATGFSPKQITIKPDTKVVWINQSGVEATINSNPHPTHTNYPPLNLGQFPKNNKLSLIFRNRGQYGYHNHFDANQGGTIIVK